MSANAIAYIFFSFSLPRFFSFLALAFGQRVKRAKIFLCRVACLRFCLVVCLGTGLFSYLVSFYACLFACLLLVVFLRGCSCFFVFQNIAICLMGLCCYVVSVRVCLFGVRIHVYS